MTCRHFQSEKETYQKKKESYTTHQIHLGIPKAHFAQS